MTAALRVQGLHKTFGRTPVIRGIDLTVQQGERHALIGPNGAGKSTLFHLVSGRLRPDRGQVHLQGEDITGKPPHQILRRGLSRSFQITSVFPRLSVYDNLRCAVLGASGHRHVFWRQMAPLHAIHQRTEAMLERIGLSHRASVSAADLSYAEQRCLDMGMALVGGASVVLLDEPTAGMSRSEADQAVERIRTLTAGLTLLMVEHDMQVVFDLADRVSVLVYGQVIASGTPADIRSNPRVQEAYLGCCMDIHRPEQGMTEPSGGAT